MNGHTNEKNKAPCMIDWIYWIDVRKWNNALVLNDEAGRISNQLRLYFTNVHSVVVRTFNEFKKALEDSGFEGIQFDLIFCTYLFHQLTADGRNAKTIIEKLHSVLSDEGNLVFGYMHASNLMGYVIHKMLYNQAPRNYNKYSQMNKGKITAKDYHHSLTKIKSFKQIGSLFVYPNHEQPWTMSNSDIFAHRVRDWKKRTRRNSILLWFMSSRCTSLLCKYWWPYRILIFGKQDERYKHD